MKNTMKELPAFHCFLIAILASAISLFAFSTPAIAETQWDVGISGGKDGIDGFHLSVGDYYHVPERDVVIIRDRGVYDEELPVVFYLAKNARVSPGAIVDLHLRGMSWMDITLHFGLSPEIYYVPVTIIEDRRPHGHAYGYYKNHPKRQEWKKISLSDDDVVNQVNLKFISDRYGYSPDQVMKYRSDGRKFTVIDQDIRQEKHKRGGGDKGKNSSVKSKGKGGAEKAVHSGGKEKNSSVKSGGDIIWKENKHEGKGKK